MKQLEKIKIHVPIYSMNIDFRLGNIHSLKEAVQKDYKVQLEESEEFLSNLGGITVNLEKNYNVGGTLLIALDKFWDFTFSYSLPIIMHEIIHATNMIIGNRGMTCNQDDDENLTYISSYIFDQFLQKIGIDKLKFPENDENDEKNSQKSSK